VTDIRTIADLVVLDAPVAVWHDCQEDTYLALCPACHRLVAYDAEDNLYLDLVWSEYRCCQGCRARMSFADNPRLVGAVLDVWYTTGAYPQSASWVEAIPWYEYMARGPAIEAALEAATAPAIGDERPVERYVSTT
jgi:hypothetical protein